MDTAQTNLFTVSVNIVLCAWSLIFILTRIPTTKMPARIINAMRADCSSLLSNTKANTARCSISASPQRKWAAM